MMGQAVRRRGEDLLPVMSLSFEMQGLKGVDEHEADEAAVVGCPDLLDDHFHVTVALGAEEGCKLCFQAEGFCR